MKSHYKNGFTLIELLVVISIIGLLAALALVSFQGARRAARDGKRRTDLEEIRSDLEICRSDTGSYPTVPLVSGDDIVCDGTTYSTIPNDPIPSQQYSYSGSANSYNLCAALEAGGGTVSGCGSCGSSATCNYQVTSP